MKKRWKGLCALWIVLALVIGTFPVAGAVEDVPESAAAAVSEDAGDDESQVLEESGSIENSLEEKPETDSSEMGNMESAEKENAESLTENEGTAGSLAENEGTGESSAEKEGATGSSVEEEGIAESSAGKEEAMGDSTKDETSTAPGQSVESRTDEGTEETALKEGEKESGKSEESPSKEDSKKEILETTAPAFTAPEQPRRTAFSARAAAAREVVATSANAWLYVGSDEIKINETYLGDTESTPLYRQQVTVQFDVSFGSQSGMKDITVPADKKLNGWNLWGFNGSGYVTEDLGELELTGQISADEYQSFNIDNIYSFLLIEPLWRNARDILDGDSLVMNIGDSCNLSEGTWKVEGDTTVYTVGAGGCTVYAARNGTFKFSNNSAP